ncbi:SDR family NAD(P)-dependent oxidoreductase [Thalassococcus sp. S3]|uniref:SDR family NAD(P)-dependent oxidoreductase n=1 Tax=Thalassococcus sp. S3 TaxID=2017482 RepID=UPI001023FE1A|nr:SDR family NAD(P)-dependent oxidoreductase [Thalassococcus sp. S3]QBF33118.1 hypothetical protein CFI11_18085 [Thalassococcus sp. S3]
MPNSLKDKVILITGAARGLGYAYAEMLVAQGARLAVHDGGVSKDGADPDPKIIEEAAMRLRAGGADIQALPGLLNSRSACHAVVEAVLDRFGRIDGLIHNAGLVLWADTVEVDEALYRRNGEVNHEAAFWLCQAVLPTMRAQGFGRIVLTTSGWALKALEGSDRLTLYCLSKGAQFGLMRAMAYGAGHAGIRTNAISPVADTRIYTRKVEPGRLSPGSVASTVAWLVSPDCEMTGYVVRAADGKVALMQMVETEEAVLDAEALADPKAAGSVLRGLQARD